MAKIDELKEHLKILRFWLGIDIAVLLAWLVYIINYSNITKLMLIGGVILSCIFVVLAIFISRTMSKKCKKNRQTQIKGFLWKYLLLV